MSSYQITCITKPHPTSPHEHITHVGNGAVWYESVPNVINYIRTSTHTFYVLDNNGHRADVHVVAANGTTREYIRTAKDGYYTDNLLSLNQCSI